LYTNNHRNIAKLILEKLTLENVFERIYTVDDMPVNLKTRIKKGKKINKTDKKVFKYIKPSKWRLKKILEDFNADPYNCLSIGDRYYIDIKISEELGMKAFLVNSVDEVIQVCTILKNNE
jgi:FMN phosphatase YigB (HAD superfamily)